VGIANPQQIGCDGEGHSFAFVDEGYSLAGSDVNCAIHTVDNVERSYLRIDKEL
jgi:hypothetical protein